MTDHKAAGMNGAGGQEPDGTASETTATRTDKPAAAIPHRPTVVEACPACDDSAINERVEATPTYRCDGCGFEFDEPRERPPKRAPHEGTPAFDAVAALEAGGTLHITTMTHSGGKAIHVDETCRAFAEDSTIRAITHPGELPLSYNPCSYCIGGEDA